MATGCRIDNGPRFAPASSTSPPGSAAIGATASIFGASDRFDFVILAISRNQRRIAYSLRSRTLPPMMYHDKQQQCIKTGSHIVEHNAQAAVQPLKLACGPWFYDVEDPKKD